MKIFSHILFLTLISLSSGIAFGDEPLAKKVPQDDLSSAFLAKYQKMGEKEVIAIRFPGWKEEIKMRTYRVTTEIVETKTRNIKDKSGKEVVETYEVKVPVTEERVETYSDFTPLPPIKGEVPLAEVKAWNIKGKPITTDELKTLLSKPTYVFSIENEIEPNQPPIDPFYASVLRSDLIFMHSPKLNELYEQSIVYEDVPQETDLPVPAEPAPAPAPAVDDPHSNR